MEIITLKNTSRKPYIYKVTNLETGQYYIGSQCRGKIIGVNYFTSSKNKEFKEDFKTHKEEKYKIIIIKEFEDPDECVMVENYMIKNHMILKDGLCLNRSYFCNGEKIFSRVGTHHSEEARKKISEAHKGTHHSEETRKKISEIQKGTHQSEETKQKISQAHKGILHSEEARKKISQAHKGILHSEETKKKISLAGKRIKISIEGEVFSSITEASKYHNVSTTTIRGWIKNKKHNAFYVK